MVYLLVNKLIQIKKIMLLGKSQRPNASLIEKNDDASLVLLLIQGRYLEAYQLVSQQPENLANLYNKALCLYFAELPDTALLLLDQAFALTSNQLKEIPSADSAILAKIKAMQGKNKDYLQPINQFYTDHFPLQVWDNLWRIKIDCLVQLEQWDEILLHVPKLIEKHHYQNINQAIALAQQNKKESE